MDPEYLKNISEWPWLVRQFYVTKIKRGWSFLFQSAFCFFADAFGIGLPYIPHVPAGFDHDLVTIVIWLHENREFRAWVSTYIILVWYHDVITYP